MVGDERVVHVQAHWEDRGGRGGTLEGLRPVAQNRDALFVAELVLGNCVYQVSVLIWPLQIRRVNGCAGGLKGEVSHAEVYANDGGYMDQVWDYPHY